MARQLLGTGPSGKTRSRYLELTEGRESTPGRYYGWCGDLPTYCSMLSGCENGKILNRAALNGGKWRPGRNIVDLMNWAKAKNAWTAAAKDVLPSVGDMYVRIRSDGDHIGFVESIALVGNVYYITSIDGNSWGNVVLRNAWEYIPAKYRGFITTGKLPDKTDAKSASYIAWTTSKNSLVDSEPPDTLPDGQGGNGSELSAAEVA
jgi:hypothetical protein